MLDWGVAPPERSVLQRGDWSVIVERDRLEHITVRGVRVLRSIRCVVRDRDWRTFPVQDAALTVLDGSEQRLTARVSALAVLDDQKVSFTLDMTIDGETLSATLRAEAITPVLRARLGLIVLHPLEESGTVMTVIHPEGSTSAAALGPEISPHQPARDIVGLRWDRGALSCDLTLSGDLFEMEDQRNWIDASFKTYSTPLAVPFPVQLMAGDVVEHRLDLRVQHAGNSAVQPAAFAEVINLEPSRGHLPAMTLSATTAPGAVSALPRQFSGATLLVEVPLGTSAATIIDRACAEAAGAPLDVRFITDDPNAVAHAARELAERVRESQSSVARLGVTSPRSQVTERALWVALGHAAAVFGTEVPTLVAGARSHFTELNRRQADLPDDAPALVFSLTPQMHDESSSQIVESLDVVPRLMADARRIAGDRSLIVGPITLRPRYNSVASTSPPEANDVEVSGYGAHLVPEATDRRWQSAAAGVWLLGMLERVCAPGVEAVALGEVRGPRGFVALDGALTPAGTVVAWYLAHAEGERVHLEGLPEGVHGLAVKVASGGVSLLVGSLRSEPVLVRVRDREGSIHTLDIAPGTLLNASL